MIDIKFLRENPDIVKENIKKKFQDHKLCLVDEVIDFDKKYRETKLNGDNLRAERKSLSSQIGNLMKAGQKDEAESVKKQVEEINTKLSENEKLEEEYFEEIKSRMMKIPNIMHESVPIGEDDSKNVEIEKFVFCDSSDEMIRIAKERFHYQKAEFCVCDIQKLNYANEFDVITAIQINHYLHIDERRIALSKCYEALKDKGIFISFENFAPFTDIGKSVYLEKWKR